MTTRAAGQNEVALQWRSDYGTAISGFGSGCAWPNDIGIGAPLARPAYPNTWLRLERIDSRFWGYSSTNGTNWTLLRGSPYNFLALNGNEAALRTDGNLQTNLHLGLAVTAHNDGDTTGGVAVFSEWKAYTPVPIQITTQPPATLSVPANTTLTITVVVAGDPVHYQWQKGGVDLTNETSATLTIPLVQTSDAGSYALRSYSGQTSVTSSPSVVTVTADVTPPTITQVSADGTFTAVLVRYSEPVNATAEVQGNYGINKGIAVTGVTRISADTVRLTTARMAEGTDYTLTVNNVQDTGTPPNNIVAGTTANFKSWVWASGAVYNKFWDNFGANNIGALTTLATFPFLPSRVTIEQRWEYPANGGGEGGANYGNQLSGWFVPAQTSDYVFFTCSDDPSDLYLSTDENPANKLLIARETGWSNPRNWNSVGSGSIVTDKRSDSFSATEWTNGNTITLQAGRRYYLESLHTEGGGGDNVGATFIIAGAADPANGTAPALTGSLVGVYVDPGTISLTITQQPASVSITENTSPTFSVGISSSWGLPQYQWQKAPASGAFADIAGANQSTYTPPPVLLAETGSRYRVTITVPSLTNTSDVATLTILPDTGPPTLVSAMRIFADNTKVTVVFSELMDPASANTAANYQINNGITVSAAALAADGKSVVLTTSAIAKGTTNTLTVNVVKDKALNPIAANSQILIGFQRGALFVFGSGDPGTVNVSDGILRDRLQSKGYDVQVVSSSLDDVSMASGRDLVLVSSTIPSGNVLATYKDVPVPVILWEQAIQDDMAMTTVTGTADRGNTGGQTAMDIVNATHPMAAGLSTGVVSVATAGNDIAWGQPNANAQVVARVVGSAANACIYGYEKGALLTDDTPAAERRVVFGMSDNFAAAMNATGFRLFDAAVNWAQHLAVALPPPQFTSVTVTNGNFTVLWSNGGTLQSTTNLNPPVIWINETGNGSFTAPATGSAKFFKVIP